MVGEKHLLQAFKNIRTGENLLWAFFYHSCRLLHLAYDTADRNWLKHVRALATYRALIISRCRLPIRLRSFLASRGNHKPQAHWTFTDVRHGHQITFFLSGTCQIAAPAARACDLDTFWKSAYNSAQSSNVCQISTPNYNDVWFGKQPWSARNLLAYIVGQNSAHSKALYWEQNK